MFFPCKLENWIGSMDVLNDSGCVSNFGPENMYVYIYIFTHYINTLYVCECMYISICIYVYMYIIYFFFYHILYHIYIYIPVHVSSYILSCFLFPKGEASAFCALPRSRSRGLPSSRPGVWGPLARCPLVEANQSVFLKDFRGILAEKSPCWGWNLLKSG